MDFLINPNVSYLLLILGFLTAILALFAPGTGLLEVGALITLTLAAYGIVNLPFHWWALLIIGVSMIPMVFALRQPVRTRAILLAAATLLFVAGSAFLFRGQGWMPAVNPLLILVVTPVAVGLTWFIAHKAVEASLARPTFDLDRLTGMTGKASSDIRGQGTVYVDGEEWSATSKTYVPAGSPVRVVSRSGLTLEVEPDKSPEVSPGVSQ